mmetsp:Transcript_27549/g.110355  ORF Transcript_27549/g.110355 Transcript_27549/m.110355 type:complete len:315 (+) Transcript_27549:1419-2363(+)
MMTRSTTRSNPRAATSVATRSLKSPRLNAAIVFSRSFCATSPWSARRSHRSAFDSTIALHSTLVSQNKMHRASSDALYAPRTSFTTSGTCDQCAGTHTCLTSVEVSAFCVVSSRCCLASSAPTRSISTSFAPRAYLAAVLWTHEGTVAENSRSCRSADGPMLSNRASSSFWKPMLSISSASSSAKIFVSASRSARRLIMSYTRPGVPTTTWTPFWSVRMSSRTAVPPTHAWMRIDMKSPSARITLTICCASSRVGASTRAWHSCSELSTCWRMPIENVAVLPVPDWACAMTSRPMSMGLMARCWMADGFSKPYA